MDFVRSRLPPLGEAITVFGVVVFAVHTWSAREFLFRLPSFVLKYDSGEILSIVSYHLVFAFLESLIACSALIVLSAILPSTWLRKGFTYKGFLLILVATIGSILVQTGFTDGEFVIDYADVRLLLLYAAAGFLVFLGLMLLFQKVDMLQRLATQAVDQISVMLYLYLPLDLAGLIVVGIRLLR